MLSSVLSEGLAAYGIGEELRRLRLKKKLGLVELGRHTGLSPALLSKIERGLMFPTLPTLLRIAMVFAVGLEHFFEKETGRPRASVVRRRDRRRFPDDPGGKNVAYHFESLDFTSTDRKLNAYYAEFESLPPERVEPHVHPGVELLYVIRGKLIVRVGSDEHVLQAGDSIYFDATVPHGYRRKGTPRCAAMVVTVP